MKNFFFILTVFVLCSASTTLAQWSNGQAAELVLGQANFTSKTSGSGQNKFNLPNDVAVDPSTGKIFVAEDGNNRILRFKDITSLQNNDNAEVVFGQPDFTTISAGRAKNKFDGVTGIFVDNEGRLWVAEYNNRRVLWFNDAATTSTNGNNADGVLGQVNFTTLNFTGSQTIMGGVTDIFVSANGTLWVADNMYRRVLKYNDAKNKSNGAAADGVLGQTDFNSDATTVDEKTIGGRPWGLVMINNSLFVSDIYNYRILRFDDAENLANGAAASAVIGQPDFTTTNNGVTNQRFYTPGGLTTDGKGNLYVVDGGKYLPTLGNNRILIFNNATSLSNNPTANFVIGQSGFTTDVSATTATGLNIPWGAAYDTTNNKLLVADTENHRVLVYSPSSSTNIEKNKPLITSTFVLNQNYPNPFNPTTTISYEIPKKEFVTLKVYNFIGQEVASLVNHEQPAGTYSLSFNANALSTGVYFYKLQAGNFTETKKMTLIK